MSCRVSSASNLGRQAKRLLYASFLVPRFLRFVLKPNDPSKLVHDDFDARIYSTPLLAAMNQQEFATQERTVGREVMTPA
jgi:hypothetical protein